jgi:hypothetical protein
MDVTDYRACRDFPKAARRLTSHLLSHPSINA